MGERRVAKVTIADPGSSSGGGTFLLVFFYFFSVGRSIFKKEKSEHEQMNLVWPNEETSSL